MEAFEELLIRNCDGDMDRYQGNDVKKEPRKISHRQYQELVKSTYKFNEDKSYLRFGQTLYNLLHQLSPELCGVVNGTKSDPFHTGKHENSLSVCKFYDAIVDQNL